MFNDPHTEAKLCQMVATAKKLMRLGRSFEISVRYYPKERKLVYRVTQDDLQEDQLT